MRIIMIVLTVLLIVPARSIHADGFSRGLILLTDKSRGTVAAEVPHRPGDQTKKDWDKRRFQQSLRCRQFPPAVDVMDRHHLPADSGVKPRVLAQGSVDNNRGAVTSSTVPGNVPPVHPDSHIRRHEDTTGVRHRIGRENKPIKKQGPPGGGNGLPQKKEGASSGYHGR